MKKIIAISLALVLCVGMLCVGVSAADDYWCIAGTMNGWNSDSSDRLTDNGDGTFSITFADMAAGTYEFKFTKNGGWDNCLGGAFMGSGVEAPLSSPGSNIVFTLTEAEDVTIVLDVANSKFTLSIGNQVAEAPENITIHVTVPEDWGTAYGYVWGPESLGSWPGTAVENGALVLPAMFDGFIVNNNNGRQTADITDIDLTKAEVWVTVNADNSYSLSYEAPAGEEPAVPTLEDGKYVIAWNGLTFAALEESSPYGYAPAGNAAEPVETDHITITNVADGQFTMQDCYGRYLYMKGTYNSFNVSEELPESGYLWVLEETEGGFFIKNVDKEKYISYSEQYVTWGCYASTYPSGVVTFAEVVEEPVAAPIIRINVVAEHWTNIYAYTFNAELNGSWPGTLVENGAFEVEAAFAGLVLNNGEGQQTADITDIDLTQAEVWITVNADNTYTLSYEAPVVDPVLPGTGDGFAACVLALMFSGACLLGLTKKKF